MVTWITALTVNNYTSEEKQIKFKSLYTKQYVYITLGVPETKPPCKALEHGSVVLLLLGGPV